MLLNSIKTPPFPEKIFFFSDILPQNIFVNFKIKNCFYFQDLTNVSFLIFTMLTIILLL